MKHRSLSLTTKRCPKKKKDQTTAVILIPLHTARTWKWITTIHILRISKPSKRQLVHRQGLPLITQVTAMRGLLMLFLSPLLSISCKEVEMALCLHKISNFKAAVEGRAMISPRLQWMKKPTQYLLKMICYRDHHHLNICRTLQILDSLKTTGSPQ